MIGERVPRLFRSEATRDVRVLLVVVDWSGLWPPSLREVAAAAGCSLSQAHESVARLSAAGLVAHEAGLPRTLRSLVGRVPVPA